MKVLVLNPASNMTKNVVRDVLYGCWCKGKRIGGATVPPFALLSVATVLKEAGFSVDFLDAAAEQIGFDDVRKRISDYSAVVISTSTMSFQEDSAFLEGLKEVNASLKTIVFGSHPTFMPEYCLEKRSIDIIVRREPEFIVRDLLLKIAEGESYKDVLGIGFREDGRCVINPHYPFIENLDELPFLDTSFLPADIDYFNPIVKRLPCITTVTSRGCPGRCTFCTAPFFYGPKIRLRSAENVLEELEYYKKRGFSEVYFRDETFTVNRDRVREICEGIIKRDLDLLWICNARVGTVDRELLFLMKRAGCHLIKFGVESGVQHILDKAKKQIKTETTRENFRWAKEAGIDTHAHIMLGMPGETEETIEATIRFAKEIEPTTATFGICTPYPGTPLFDEVKRVYPEIEDGSDSDLSKLHTEGLFNEIYTSVKKEHLKKSIKRAYRSFYLRPSYILSFIKRIEGLDDLKRLIIAGTNVLDFSVRGE